MDTIYELSFELRFLLYSAFLFFMFILVNVISQVRAAGVPALFGNRDGDLPTTVFCGRSQRLVSNMQENLVLFGAVVLVAAATGISTPGTMMGVQLFFYGRVAHGLFYLLGIPYARSIAWIVSIIGMAMIFVDLLSV